MQNASNFFSTPNKRNLLATSIVYVLLIALGLTWLLLGNIWYERVVPFYDSLSYQNKTEEIIRAYQTNGWMQAPLPFMSQGVLFELVIAVLAPVLPLARTTLYIYLIPLHLVSLQVLFNFLYHKTNSLALAFLGPLLFISTSPFNSLIQGVLDQRMDLATTSFGLLLWVVALDWAESYDSLQKTISLGFVLGLAMLHRPIIAVQASGPGIVLLLYVLLKAKQSGKLLAVLRRMGVVFLIGAILFAPWFVVHAQSIYKYYAVTNIDVRKFSFFEAFSFYFVRVISFVGIPTLLLIGIILFTLYFLKRFSIKYFSIVFGLIILPIIPLIISGSSNSPVAQISLAGVGLVPLVFDKKKPLYKTVSVVFVLLACGLAVWNVVVLTKTVISIDNKEKLSAEKIITNINNEYPFASQKTYLSSFVLVGGGASGLASISRLELGLPLYPGISYGQTSEFGLNPREIAFSEEQLNFAVSCALQKVYELGGILMLVEPSQIEEVQPKLIPDWLFSHQQAIRINKLAIQDGRLVDINVKATLEGIPVHFYMVKTGEFPHVIECDN